MTRPSPPPAPRQGDFVIWAFYAFSDLQSLHTTEQAAYAARSAHLEAERSQFENDVEVDRYARRLTVTSLIVNDTPVQSTGASRS